MMPRIQKILQIVVFDHSLACALLFLYLICPQATTFDITLVYLDFHNSNNNKC